MDCKMTGNMSFSEIASAKFAQKMTNPVDESRRSFNDKPEDKDTISFYENFRQKERRLEIARQEKRKFKLEQEAKRKRRAQYVRIIKESALKRRLREQEAGGRHYTSCTSRKETVAVCDIGSVSVPVSKESIALLLADREQVFKESELEVLREFHEDRIEADRDNKKNLKI